MDFFCHSLYLLNYPPPFPLTLWWYSFPLMSLPPLWLYFFSTNSSSFACALSVAIYWGFNPWFFSYNTCDPGYLHPFPQIWHHLYSHPQLKSFYWILGLYLLDFLNISIYLSYNIWSSVPNLTLVTSISSNAPNHIYPKAHIKTFKSTLSWSEKVYHWNFSILPPKCLLNPCFSLLLPLGFHCHWFSVNFYHLCQNYYLSLLTGFYFLSVSTSPSPNSMVMWYVLRSLLVVMNSGCYM